MTNYPYLRQPLMYTNSYRVSRKEVNSVKSEYLLFEGIEPIPVRSLNSRHNAQLYTPPLPTPPTLNQTYALRLSRKEVSSVRNEIILSYNV